VPMRRVASISKVSRGDLQRPRVVNSSAKFNFLLGCSFQPLGSYREPTSASAGKLKGA